MWADKQDQLWYFQVKTQAKETKFVAYYLPLQRNECS